jgi:hypothetical protein
MFCPAQNQGGKMRKLLAELLLAALATSTQHWQQQEDAAACLVFKDSGLFCDSNYDLGSL